MWPVNGFGIAGLSQPREFLANLRSNGMVVAHRRIWTMFLATFCIGGPRPRWIPGPNASKLTRMTPLCSRSAQAKNAIALPN
jgi:hypothetical protein